MQLHYVIRRTINTDLAETMCSLWNVFPFVVMTSEPKVRAISGSGSGNQSEVSAIIIRPPNDAWLQLVTRLFYDMAFDANSLTQTVRSLVSLHRQWKGETKTWKIVAGAFGAGILTVGAAWLSSYSYNAGKRNVTEKDRQNAIGDGYKAGIEAANVDIYNQGYMEGFGLLTSHSVPVPFDETRRAGLQALRQGVALSQSI